MTQGPRKRHRAARRREGLPWSHRPGPTRLLGRRRNSKPGQSTVRSSGCHRRAAVLTPQPVDDIHWIAQSIVPASNFFVSRVTLWVRDDGTTGDPLVVSLRDDVSGAPGSSDITQGTAVGTTAPGGGWTDFDMATYIELVGGSTYWIVVHSAASAGNGHSYWDSLTDLPYGPGTGRVSLDG